MPTERRRSEDVVRTIKRTLRMLVAATAVLFVLLIGNAFWTRSIASSNNNALCTLRADLEQRVAGSRKFLEDHPEGFAGITRATIQTGIDGQQRTIVALSNLHCDYEVPQATPSPE